ncbi:MAG: hypothetical protein ABJB97_01720 [Acidobacteriota bacterium]
MTSIRGFALGLTLGLAAAIGTVGIAQNTKPMGQGNKAESCCSMASCCCQGDSCEMKDHAKNNSQKGGCCCCGGDSCGMKMKEKMKDNQKQG